MKEHISCDFISKFNCTTCNSKQKLNNKTCQCECKNYHNCKKYYCWNPSRSISVADTSVTKCNGLWLIWIIYQQKTTNVTSTVSINCQSGKVRDC